MTPKIGSTPLRRVHSTEHKHDLLTRSRVARSIWVKKMWIFRKWNSTPAKARKREYLGEYYLLCENIPPEWAVPIEFSPELPKIRIGYDINQRLAQTILRAIGPWMTHVLREHTWLYKLVPGILHLKNVLLCSTKSRLVNKCITKCNGNRLAELWISKFGGNSARSIVKVFVAHKKNNFLY